jgi:hypothetical protein
MKKIFLVSCFFIFSSLYAQESIFNFEKLEGRKGKPLGTSFLELPEMDNNLILVKYKKGLDAYFISPDYNIIATAGTDDLPKRFDNVVGQTVKGDQIKIFLSFVLGRYASLSLDFNANSIVEERIKLDLEKEYVMGHTSLGENLYVFSLQKKSSVVTIHIINHDGSVQKKELDFSSQTFVDYDGDDGTLYNLVKGYSNNAFKTLDASTIQYKFANPLENTSKKIKMYPQGDKVIFTLDSSNRYTYLMEISLTDFKHATYSYPKPKFSETLFYGRTNALLYKDVLMQFAANDDKMDFVIKNRSDQSVIKTYTVKKNENLSIANTPVLMEGGTYNPNRERKIYKTSIFLKKINKSNLGISIVETQGNYQISLGSSRPLPPPSSGSMMNPLAMSGGSMATTGPLFFRDYGSSFTLYRNTKSVRFDGLFNKDFEHLKGKIPNHPFYTIDTYLNKLDQKFLAETVVKTKDGFLCLYFDSSDEIFKCYTF